MPKRYRFRKVYFICEENQIFADYKFINCYKDLDYVNSVCMANQRMLIEDANKLYNKGQKIRVLKVEGFYLVHESLFQELLKKHSKE